MYKKLALAFVLFFLGTTTVFATGWSFLYEPFSNHFSETWYPATYEGGQLSESLCGTHTCGTLESSWFKKYFRFTLKDTTVPGIYTDTELREEPHDADIDAGPWTPTLNHPVVLKSRIRMDDSHNFDGSGGAVGTLGVGLWNNAALPDSAHPDYDAIAFSWIQDDFIDLFGIDGFTGNAAVNLAPVGVVVPSTPVNLQQWTDIKLVWSVDANGDQSVKFYVNGSSFGTIALPTPLQGLNVVAWQDNQIFDENFQVQYLSPTEDQTFDVDYIKVFQL